MEERNVHTGSEKLIQSRKEALESIGSPIRPLGKLWGMDVFAWLRPETGALINTLGSFPFKVTWIGGIEELTSVFAEDQTVVRNLEALVVHNSNVFELNSLWIGEVNTAVGTSDLSDALHFLEQLKSNKRMVLFTASGENSLSLLRQFESFVEHRRNE
ncbi:MAG: hypothetical protein LW688_05250 [Cryomorphaceae bacterium]|jgi:hypothetical protein|nr:hypothetical protein [Cryomorphaceae bacterium]